MSKLIINMHYFAITCNEIRAEHQVQILYNNTRLYNKKVDYHIGINASLNLLDDAIGFSFETVFYSVDFLE
jgi:hypothetical protein